MDLGSGAGRCCESVELVTGSRLRLGIPYPATHGLLQTAASREGERGIDLGALLHSGW